MYAVALEGKGTRMRGVTLFEACLAARAMGNGGIVLAHGHLIAFYCGWRKCVAVGFGATPNERREIEEAFGVAPAI